MTETRVSVTWLTQEAYDRLKNELDYLTGEGRVFDRPPMAIELSGTPVPDMWITFISDPNGIPYEFVQRPRSAFKS